MAFRAWGVQEFRTLCRRFQISLEEGSGVQGWVKIWGRGAGVEGIMDPGPRFKSAFGLQASSQLSRVPSGNWVTFVIFYNHWQVGRSGHTMSYIRWHVDKQGSAHRATPNNGVI